MLDNEICIWQYKTDNVRMIYMRNKKQVFNLSVSFQPVFIIIVPSDTLNLSD